MVLSNANFNKIVKERGYNDHVEHLLDSKYLSITPLLPNSVQPGSVDLHLDKNILVEPVYAHPKVIRPKVDTPTYKKIDLSLPGNRVILEPGQFMLGSTTETVTLGAPVSAIVMGKSSLARIGLTVAPGFIDPGFSGTITLEIFNTSRNKIVLEENMGICQLVVYVLADPATTLYGAKELNSKYQDQQGATPIRAAAHE